MTVWAVLAAAGAGERLGADRPKAFVALGSRVLLAESLERLDESRWIDAIVVAAPAGWEEPVSILAEELAVGKVAAVVTGGASRGESVRAAAAEVADDALVIVVHDAARPLVTDAMIERVLQPLGEGWDGAVPGLPLVDTVKRVGPDGGIVDTVDRAGLWTVQTPQAFDAEVFRRALAGAVAASTDCASLVEAAGGRVKVVEGDAGLVKVTTRADLARVEALLVEDGP